jgi:hypothetical protein
MTAQLTYSLNTPVADLLYEDKGQAMWHHFGPAFGALLARLDPLTIGADSIWRYFVWLIRR